MRRRAFLAGVAAAAASVVTPIVTAAAYTTRQLVAACRLWLKRHHVRRYATVTIIPGDGPPRPAYLEPGDTWRWSPTSRAFVGPAFEVAWGASDSIPSFTSPIDGQRVQLYVGPWTVEGRPALADADHAGRVSVFGLLASDGPGDPVAGGLGSTPREAGSGVAFVLQAPVVHESAQNFVPNPSFETGTTSWSSVNLSALGTSAANAASGTQAMTVAPDTGFADPTSGTVTSSFPITVTGSSTLSTQTASVYVSTASPDLEVDVGITFFAGAGQLNSTATAYHPIGASPTRLSVSGAPSTPANRAFVSVTVHVVGGARVLTSADLVYVDAAMLNLGDSPLPYFDGSTIDDTTYDYAWSGTAHNSYSTRTPLSAPAVPDAPDSPELDVTEMLGDEVTVGSTFTYEDVDGVGDDGDWYVDTSGKALYGPKDDVWPDEPAVEGLNLTRLVR